MPRLSVNLPWNPDFVETFLNRARLADEIGIDTIAVIEGYGHDAFSGLALLARETSRIRLATAVVNVFSRTPSALAMHFGTIDQLSGGRVVVGLGASGPGAIERFHGVPFDRPFARIRETMEIIRRVWAHERFDYHSDWINIERALVSGMEPVQASPPIHLATLHPTSVRLAAEQADGWMPAWIPNDRLVEQLAAVRAQVVAAGRDAAALEIRSPATTVVVPDPERVAEVERNHAQGMAFFSVRSGPMYWNQFQRQGLGAEVEAMRDAWAEGGVAAAAAAGAEASLRFGRRGGREECLAQLDLESAAGVDLHQVSVATDDDRVWADELSALIG